MTDKEFDELMTAYEDAFIVNPSRFSDMTINEMRKAVKLLLFTQKQEERQKEKLEQLLRTKPRKLLVIKPTSYT